MKKKKLRRSSVSGASGAVYVCIATLCLCMLQDQSTSPAKTRSPSGKRPQHCVLVPQDTLCLPLPGTTGQVPALLLGLGTACFEHRWQEKQEQMCLWAVLAHLPGTGRSCSSGIAARRHLPLCCWTPGTCWPPVPALPHALSQSPVLCTEGIGQQSCSVCRIN